MTLRIAGVIAEDDSDVDVTFNLISRVAKKSNYSKMRFAAGGCGRIRNKLTAWCENFSQRGCNRLIIVHDLDRNELGILRNELTQKLTAAKTRIQVSVIVIPIEEIEAWLLADMSALKNVFKLKKAPKNIAHPEKVKSPKEHLENLVYLSSGKEKRYLNTKHNLLISTKLDLGVLERNCGSFKVLREFVTKSF